jgi:predicted PurR-regulated permease PerM
VVVDGLAWWNSQKTYRLVFTFMLTLLIIYFIFLVRGIFLSFMLAVVLAYLLHPLVRMVESRGTGRTMSILLVYLVMFILVAAPVLYGIYDYR